MTPTRLASIALFAALSTGGAMAQPAPPPPPLPAEASTPAPFAGEPSVEPEVTIIRRDNETLEEVRIGGELRYVRVTPRHGRPYFLVADPNGGQFIRRYSLDTTVKVPMWLLLSW